MDSRKRKNKAIDQAEILLVGHAKWLPEDDYVIIPNGVSVYVYAPLGAALNQAIPRALAAGEIIESGDLIITRISPITLFNYGYEDKGEYKDDYSRRDLKDYPKLLKAGDEIPNFKMFSPGDDALQSKSSSLLIRNIEEATYLKDLLKSYENSQKTLHFGGCSWIGINHAKRDIVTFADTKREEQYTKKPSEEEKRAKRAERFGTKKS